MCFCFSVDSASGAFATNEDGTVMDTGGNKQTEQLVLAEECYRGFFSLIVKFVMSSDLIDFMECMLVQSILQIPTSENPENG